MQRVGADRAGDHAELEHPVADLHRVLVGTQPGRPHRAVAADVVDHAVGRQRREPVAEPGAHPLRLVDQSLALDDVEVDDAGGARRRVPGVRVAVTEEERRIGLERLAHGGADEHAAEWLVARRHGLGERRQVGRDAVAVGGEPRAEPSEAGDHLVEDQQRAVLVAQPADVGEVSLRRREHAAGTLHRFGEHGRDLVTTFGHQHRQRLDVVARYLQHVADEWSPALAVRRDALRARAAEVGAVVAAGAADDQRPLRVPGHDVGEAGELHRRVDRPPNPIRRRRPGRRGSRSASRACRRAGRPARS